jgi:hypothetical protein
MALRQERALIEKRRKEKKGEDRLRCQMLKKQVRVREKVKIPDSSM